MRVDRVPMDNVDMNIVLDNGVLRYDPVKVGMADGTVTLVGTLDSTGRAPRLEARLEGRNLDLAQIYPELASPRGKTGRFGGFVNVKAQRRQLARMAKAADGDGALLMSGGEASAVALLLTNLDLAGVVPLVIAGDQTASLHCAVSAFAVGDGVVQPRLLVIDTSRVRIDGEGTIDLVDEKYDLVLKSKSKQFSMFALRGPIMIERIAARPVGRAIRGADRCARRSRGWPRRPVATAGDPSLHRLRRHARRRLPARARRAGQCLGADAGRCGGTFGGHGPGSDRDAERQGPCDPGRQDTRDRETRGGRRAGAAARAQARQLIAGPAVCTPRLTTRTPARSEGVTSRRSPRSRCRPRGRLPREPRRHRGRQCIHLRWRHDRPARS